jgi:hypothetical protein
MRLALGMVSMLDNYEWILWLALANDIHVG